MHITVSVDKSEQYIVDWGGGRELGPCPPRPTMVTDGLCHLFIVFPGIV